MISLGPMYFSSIKHQYTGLLLLPYCEGAAYCWITLLVSVWLVARPLLVFPFAFMCIYVMALEQTFNFALQGIILVGV